MGDDQYVPIYPPMTEGKVAHAPKPNSIKNSFTYGFVSLSSGAYPRHTFKLLPTLPDIVEW